MWLPEEENPPDHTTFARFRTGRCAEAAEDLFYQYVRYLEAQGETDHDTVFIDGTKLESAAGRYTFVWRKSVEKQLSKVKAAASVNTLAELEKYLAQAAENIDFVHGSGKRKSLVFQDFAPQRQSDLRAAIGYLRVKNFSIVNIYKEM